MPREDERILRGKQNDREGRFHQSTEFERACEMMRKNAEKFLKDDFLSASSSSEDEIDDDAIIKKAIAQYSDTETQSLKKTRDLLQDTLTSGFLVCLICIESVRRNDKIWTCKFCYCMLHLTCIQKWAKDSLYHKSADSELQEKKSIVNWCCPKCRGEYTASEQPNKYLCFCRKEENPPFDMWNIPHSCAKPCEKNLIPDCRHTCSLLCHPGPCPPCPQTVLVSCCCSKSKPVVKRCSQKQWCCAQKCMKLLSCQLHYCDEVCHKGTCPPCKKKAEVKCCCGNKREVRSCDNAKWHCGKECGKPLACGHHFCRVVCHEGSCPPCPNSGPRACPCKKRLMTLPCTETVTPCGDTCNKILECELHRCSQRCHFGPCENCLQMRVMKCRCGQREKSVPCCKEFFCDIKCKKRRDCGRHNCNKRCCAGDCPPCEVNCGRTLTCGNHKCASVCHSGPCFPCREIVIVACNCGTTKTAVPCGSRKSAIPPRCSANCKLPADCHHPQRQKHKCHFGACPPCRLKCEKTLSCGHKCLARCHSAVLTKIQVKEKKGPWDLPDAYKMELIARDCPPCEVLVTVSCLGSHEVLSLPCNAAKSTSCGRPCGRELLCGNHTCALECHDTSSMLDSKMQSKECEDCKEPCKKPRKLDCNHPCIDRCHPGECTPCKHLLKMKCHCEIHTLHILCSKWSEADEDERLRLACCSNRCPKTMTCGHRCYYSCHTGPCGEQAHCKKKITMRCQCKRKRKEVQCCTQDKDGIICDEDCHRAIEALKMQESEERKKMEDEARKKQEEELQSYLRKSEGKKKRKKKTTENEQCDNRYTFRYIVLAAILICAFAVFMFFWLKEHK